MRSTRMVVLWLSLPSLMGETRGEFVPTHVRGSKRITHSNGGVLDEGRLHLIYWLNLSGELLTCSLCWSEQGEKKIRECGRWKSTPSSPQRCLCLPSSNLYRCYSHGKRDIADMIKVKDLSIWLSRLSSGPNLITRVLESGERFLAALRELGWQGWWKKRQEKSEYERDLTCHSWL